MQETGAQSIYFAPLEGITGYIFRNAYNEIYGNVDKYFAPFISPTGRSSMTPRDRRDLDPDNNTGMNLIPQILTCDASLFIMAAGELQDMGYKEIDLNLGCPSGTVCAKGKGAGFLPETAKLRSFLDTLSNVQKVEVLPYHSLGVFKWEQLGIPYTLKDTPAPAPESVEHALEILTGRQQ